MNHENRFQLQQSTGQQPFFSQSTTDWPSRQHLLESWWADKSVSAKYTLPLIGEFGVAAEALYMMMPPVRDISSLLPEEIDISSLLRESSYFGGGGRAEASDEELLALLLDCPDDEEEDRDDDPEDEDDDDPDPESDPDEEDDDEGVACFFFASSLNLLLSSSFVRAIDNSEPQPLNH